MALNQPSVSLAYETTLFSGNSLSTHNDVQAEAIRSRDEMVFIPPLHIVPGYSDSDNVLTDPQFVKQPLNPHYHGLSLSLGSQVPSLVQGPSSFNQLSLHTLHNESKNVKYQSSDLAGSTRVNNEAMGITGSLWNSKYLTAAQDVLDEVVSVHRALEKPDKRHEFNSLGQEGSMGVDVKGDELAIIASCELSQSERQDLQNKLMKLLSMLDEVDTRYKNYHNQMQVVVSSFEMVAGRGAARPYTTLARRTISRQFRCLRDAIKREIRVTQKALGEQDVTSRGQAVLSRLRFVDQQLRQQKALQQFGITGQPWRPQRGLPENAVSILRSWLFEHFLHPYPKDSEKIILAKQTGLTRSQVANWFINARVRLWKPMIEEMYKEEFGDTEEQPKTSPEHGTLGQEEKSFDDRDEELQGSLMLGSSEFRSDVSSSSQWDVQEAKLSYHGATYQENELNFGRTELHHDVSMSNNAIGNQVSLALGLQNSDQNPQSVYVDPENQQHRFANPHLLSDFVA